MKTTLTTLRLRLARWLCPCGYHIGRNPVRMRVVTDPENTTA